MTVSISSDVGKMKDGVQAWLGRSGALPLSLSLVGVQTRSVDPRRLCLDPILDEFISFIGRWEAVQLKVIGDFYGLVLGIGTLRAPLLRRFEGLQHFDTWTLVRPLVSFLGASPFLTDIVWDLPFDDGRGPLTARCGLPWSQLTRFESHRAIGVEEFVDVLRRCPSLVEGSFRLIAGIDDHSPQPTTSLVHHNLTTLAIYFGRDELEPFLEHLTLPMLHDLTVQTGLPYSFSSQNAFVEFLSRSQPPMKRLTLEGVGDQSAQLIDLLLLTPYIADLSIHHRFLDLDDNFFHSLTYVEGTHQTQPCLCPKLEVLSLVLSLQADMTLSRGVFATMLESRYRRDAPDVVCLKGLEVRFIGDNRDRVGKDLDRLEALREKGLSVLVSWEG